MRVTPDFIRAHRHCARHRDELLFSDACRCFYCLAIFTSSEVTNWTDFRESGAGQTALCPRCNIDSVIGSASGDPVTKEFLQLMRRYWFSAPRMAPKKPDRGSDADRQAA